MKNGSVIFRLSLKECGSYLQRQGGQCLGRTMSEEDNEELSCKHVKFKVPIKHMSEDTGLEVG